MHNSINWITLIHIFALNGIPEGIMGGTHFLCHQQTWRKTLREIVKSFLNFAKNSLQHIGIYKYTERALAIYKKKKLKLFKKDSFWISFIFPRLLFRVLFWQSNCYFFKKLILEQGNDELCFLTWQIILFNLIEIINNK